MSALQDLIKRCIELGIRGSTQAAAELARLIAIEKTAQDLFQACSNLSLEDMNKLDKEISAMSAALKAQA